jgi:NAD+ kinase
MKKIGVIFRKKEKPEAAELGFEIREWLRNKGQRVFTRLTTPILEKKLDFVITLGGDGLVLGVADRVAKFGTPLFRVNFGRRGYLCDIKPDEVFENLEKVLEGEFKIETRTRIKAEVFHEKEKILTTDALNEILLGGINRVVFLELKVSDGKKKLTVNVTGDGVIFSTETGSTAYNINAGGPLLLTNAFSVVASNAYFESEFFLPNTRTFVTSTRASFKLKSLDPRKSNLPFLVADGQRDYKLKNGDRIEIRKSPLETFFIKTK